MVKERKVVDHWISGGEPGTTCTGSGQARVVWEGVGVGGLEWAGVALVWVGAAPGWVRVELERVERPRGEPEGGLPPKN